jgi:hypothetical protein
MADIEKLQTLLEEMTPGPYQICGADRGGCQCGLIWSGPGECKVLKAFGQRNTDELDCCPTEEQRAKNANGAVAILNAAPELLASLARVTAELAEADTRTKTLEAELRTAQLRWSVESNAHAGTKQDLDEARKALRACSDQYATFAGLHGFTPGCCDDAERLLAPKSTPAASVHDALGDALRDTPSLSRCRHGAALRDGAGEALEPTCGCRADRGGDRGHVRGAPPALAERASSSQDAGRRGGVGRAPRRGRGGDGW